MSETSRYYRGIVDSSDTSKDENIRVRQLYPTTDEIMIGMPARDLLKDPDRVAVTKVEHDLSSNGDSTQKLELRLKDKTETIEGWETLEDGEYLVDTAEALFGLTGLSLVLESGITLRHAYTSVGPE